MKNDDLKGLFMDKNSGRLYEIHPYSLEFPNKSVNIPNDKSWSLIFKTNPLEMIENDFLLFPGGNYKTPYPSILCGQLFHKFGMTLRGNFKIEKLGNDEQIKLIWKGDSRDINGTFMYMKKAFRLNFNETLSLFLNSKELIDPNKSSFAIKCFHCIEQKK